ncbi:MAG: diaminobutyrate--2-oxoglutarate transaminase [Alphaproteobacteria bacterium]|nr:diaminobutyrate--2-oxoglutarate transaminase [Alphaproteobacteria bacterium]MBO6629362.1 diaminobutyrate--2-oxoglutarate transaminase [Alphaproteobacteria bacterium]
MLSDTSKTDTSIFQRRESGVRSYARNFPKKFVKAQGSTLTTDDGNTYLDFLSGCSSLNYGHNHPVLKQALMDYIESDGLTHSLDLETEAKEAFLTEFDRTILTPRGLDYVVQFPGPTGANAVEAALKVARKVTGRTNVIAFTNGFHGCTLGALAATGNQHHRNGAGVPLNGVTRMPYADYAGDDANTIALLDRMLDDPSSGIDAPAAFIVEAVQGEGGLNVASFQWLRELQKVAKRHGALLILDDIQAGIGRTGTFFSFEPAGIKPDIVTLAKSVSGYGLPMALTLFRRDLDIWEPGEHNGTFRGNCHAFVTATAALKEFWRGQDFVREVAEKSAFLKKRLTELQDAHPGTIEAVKGRGMMLGIDVGCGDLSSDIIKDCFKNGLVIETSGPNDEVVKCLTPLTITMDELERGLAILERAVKKSIDAKSKAAA